MTIRRLTRDREGVLWTEILEEDDAGCRIVKRGKGDLKASRCRKLKEPEVVKAAPVPAPVPPPPLRSPLLQGGDKGVVRGEPVTAQRVVSGPPLNPLLEGGESGAQPRVKPVPVAAIVTCHNYERFLGQCLDSLANQTVPFDQVIVVDDASDHGADVLALVDGFIGMAYERVEFRDVCKARDHGAALTTAPRLVFVDADNWLEENFLQQLSVVMDRDRKLGLVYAPAHAVDEHGTRLGGLNAVRPVTHDQLRRENAIDTCCLVRRDAFEQAGGWTPASGNHRFHDWHLWLRLTSAGWPFAYSPEPCWFYRRHGQSMSAQNVQHDHEARVRVMRETCHVAVVTAFCGRDWALERTLESYGKLGWDPSRLHLIANDNSLSGSWGYRLRQKLGKVCKGWASVTVLEDPTRAVETATNAELSNQADLRMANMLALNGAIERIYARQTAQHLGPGIDLVFTLEDDIELLGDDVLPRLLEAMHVNTAVVGGVVNQRFIQHAGNHGPGPIAYDVTSEEPYRAQRVPPSDSTEPRSVGGLGYGCNLWRAEVWRDLMPCRLSPNDDNAPPWHDVTFCSEVRRAGWELVLHQGVRTRHWREDGTHV